MKQNKNRRALNSLAPVCMLNRSTLTQIKGLMDTYRMPTLSPRRSTGMTGWYHDSRLTQCSQAILLQTSRQNYRL
jgi:hypothetical protein